MKEIEVKEAVSKLISELKTDTEYYYSWQANIAMAFKDELARCGKTVDSEMHEISNNAAKRFLDLLIYIPETVII